MIHVLHLSSEKGWRGGEQQIAYLIDEQQKHGLDVLVAARSGSSFETHCKKNNIPHVTVPFGNSYDIRTALAIKSICKGKNIDVVHMHSAKSHSVGVLAAWLGNNTPLILSRRVDFVPKSSFITRWKYNHSAIKKILCVSHKIKQIMQAYVRHPEKVVTVHSGVDLGKFSSKGSENILRDKYRLAPDTIIVGNTSALEKHKDYHTFINAISVLVKKNLPIKAFVIGSGSLESTLKRYVEEKGLKEYFIFTGFRNDIVRVLPSLNIFMITSNEEGLGTSVLDAFAAEIPVVATAAGGIPEMVIHEKTGLLAPIADAEQLAQHVERLIKDPDLKKRLIMQARQKLNEFSKQVMAAKTMDQYREVLQLK
jgi:glycosyltransferase involved in cell wall biosynthesis